MQNKSNFTNFVLCFNFFALFNYFNQNKFVFSTFFFSFTTFYLFYKLSTFKIDYSKLDLNQFDLSNFAQELDLQFKIDSSVCRLKFYKKLVNILNKELFETQIWSNLAESHFILTKKCTASHPIFSLTLKERRDYISNYSKGKKIEILKELKLKTEDLDKVTLSLDERLTFVAHLKETFDLYDTGILFKDLNEVGTLLENLTLLV